jgi:tRNA1Val (adenine37-N6)-methyltransferase
MKIGTDGVLLGAWTPITNNPFSILDIGTGTGSLLMLAQRSTAEQIDALEIDQAAYEQAVDNFENSPERSLILSSACWLKNQRDEYDLIVSNPHFIPKTTKQKMNNAI